MDIVGYHVYVKDNAIRIIRIWAWQTCRKWGQWAEYIVEFTKIYQRRIQDRQNWNRKGDWQKCNIGAEKGASGLS